MIGLPAVELCGRTRHLPTQTGAEPRPATKFIPFAVDVRPRVPCDDTRGDVARLVGGRSRARAPVLGAAVRHDAVSSTSASLPSSAPLASLALAASSAASLAAVPAAHAATLMADVGEDIFASTGVGPALCVVGTIYIGYVVFSGYETIKRLKEELTDMGYDVEEFNRVGELKAIKNAVEEGTVDGIFDKVWYQRASLAAASGSIVDVQKVQAYWKTRGINVRTLADLDKITAYMVKKYGADGKMSK